MSESRSDGVQLDMFPPYTIIKTSSRRFIVRTAENGYGIKTRIDRLCQYFGGRYVDEEGGTA